MQTKKVAEQQQRLSPIPQEDNAVITTIYGASSETASVYFILEQKLKDAAHFCERICHSRLLPAKEVGVRYTALFSHYVVQVCVW